MISLPAQQLPFTPASLAPRRSRRSAVSAARGGKNVVTRAGLFDKFKEIIPSTEEGPNDGRGGRKASAGSLIELIGMGAGLPMPSDVKVDKENVKEFESNNFDLQGKYRDEGWVDDTPQGPSFWDKLFGKKDDSK